MYREFFAPKDPSKDKDDPQRPLKEVLDDVLPRLTNVTKVVLVQSSPSSYLPQIPWGVYSFNLQEIDLSLSFHLIDSLLPATFSFPQLRRLTFRAPHIPRTDSELDSLHRIQLATFISKFLSTLTHLRIVNVAGPRGQDLGSLYNALGRFSRLELLQLDSPGVKFLARHADVLHHVEYSFPPFSPTNSLAHIKFHTLKSLVLRSFNSPPAVWTRSSPFLQSIIPTLHTLRLDSWISGDHLSSFLQTAIDLGGRGDNALQELVVSTITISSGHLPCMALAFPRLRRLQLTIERIREAGLPAISLSKNFPRSTDERNWFVFNTKEAFKGVSWGLEELVIQQEHYPGGLHALWGLMDLFSSCLPSIYSIGPRRDRPSDARKQRWGRHASR
ncbi:hypothetical protein FA15DRAFT_698118 [Coprinopsis marcescibilis]|uniref:F-box domain-containing protein n=1 Tax=Coprinopsis marcescibilis TaxID=230819 RepID=A0A5C3KEB3_COPMA|nr:hypothetical protein FA15DRAFT_698118 [Coprinopsis marcescibilis]